GCRSCQRAQTAQSRAPAASDNLVLSRRATRPAARRRPRPDAELSARKFHVEAPFTSFDHLVGAGEEGLWYFEAHSLRGLVVDHQLEFRGLLYGNVFRSSSF